MLVTSTTVTKISETNDLEGKKEHLFGFLISDTICGNWARLFLRELQGEEDDGEKYVLEWVLTPQWTGSKRVRRRPGTGCTLPRHTPQGPVYFLKPLPLWLLLS